MATEVALGDCNTNRFFLWCKKAAGNGQFFVVLVCRYQLVVSLRIIANCNLKSLIEQHFSHIFIDTVEILAVFLL